MESDRPRDRVVRAVSLPGRLGDRRVRTLVWATIIAVLFGVLELGAPIEDYARMARNTLRRHPPSGDIVIVAIDDASANAFGEWPWPRRIHAKVVDRLKAAGTNRIFFDIQFSIKSNAVDDRLFARSVARAGNVWMPATDIYDALSRENKPQLPLKMFLGHVGLASTKINYSSLAFIRRIAYRPNTSVGNYPYMGVVMANADGPRGESFRIDYAIDLKKIRTVPIVDVVNGKINPSEFKDKDVVVAFARSVRDQYFVPGDGIVNGVQVMVAAAETLKGGPQRDLGWFLPLVVAALLAGVHLFTPRRWMARTTLLVGLLGISILPLVAEERGIFFDIMPSFLIVAIAATNRAWSNFRNSYKVRGDINPISGLPNLNALRGQRTSADAVLIAARVRNFAEISSALPADDERALVAQVTGRLALGAAGARIYQGDEGIFVWVATPETSGGEHLDALHALFNSPALLDRRSIDLSVTFGIDAIPGRELANRIGATLVAADEAATEGKRWKAYDPSSLADADWRLSLLGRLDTAIDTGEIWVAYQPQLDVATGRISGAEALVRWTHPEKGAISPMEFVLAAEQHNRIEKLTQFVLHDAIRVAADINARGIVFDIAVNLSARLLEKPGLTAMVRAMLESARLDPERLTLEVTESAAMTSGRASIRTLEELGSLGISISIDDYGTGFSTLEYFKLIPAAEVKIDKSFVAAIDRNASDRLMVRSTIELAHSLGRTVVAEGVETPEVLAELTKLGCDKIQGYLIGKPMKAVMLDGLIQDRANAHAA